MDAGAVAADAGKQLGTKIAVREVQGAPTQGRAIQTRHALLHAARRMFARDGFEGARLQDIAEAAGKTRGALYDHFEDKEDLFFALIAEDVLQDNEVYQSKLRPDSSREERIAVLTGQLEALLRDRQRMLLYLEFKLYAVRRPHKQERLAELHAAMCYQGVNKKLELVPELAIEDPAERRRAIASFGAVLDGLALNLYFDPIGLTEAEIHRKIERAVRERITRD